MIRRPHLERTQTVTRQTRDTLTHEGEVYYPVPLIRRLGTGPLCKYDESPSRWTSCYSGVLWHLDLGPVSPALESFKLPSDEDAGINRLRLRYISVHLNDEHLAVAEDLVPEPEKAVFLESLGSPYNSWYSDWALKKVSPPFFESTTALMPLYGMVIQLRKKGQPWNGPAAPASLVINHKGHAVIIDPVETPVESSQETF